MVPHVSPFSFLAPQPGTSIPSPFYSHNKLPLSAAERKKRERNAISHEETHNSLLTTVRETYYVHGFSFKMLTTHTHTPHKFLYHHKAKVTIIFIVYLFITKVRFVHVINIY